MPPPHVLILGGYGAFGGRVAERLARVPGITLTIAGRSRERAETFAGQISARGGGQASFAVLDGASMTPAELRQSGAAVLVNASGPFQEQDFTVARACVVAGMHYIDLADASAFVAKIDELDAEARRANVLVTSGASTVPAVSGAAVDALASEFAQIETVSTVITPGNSFSPGLSTTRSILGGLGRPIIGHGARVVYGWQGLERRQVPELGGRWISHCDAPDRVLFPRRHQGLISADVYAALEVGPFHLGLWALAGLVRVGLVRRPERLAERLLALKEKLAFLGSDRGGMLVSVAGWDSGGRRKHIDWHLAAGSGHGPYIPATPAVLLTRRLLDGSLQVRGAMPCIGLLSLDDILAEIADLDITTGTA
jgi:hypothetical protein